jgi:hypothetical protein
MVIVLFVVYAVESLGLLHQRFVRFWPLLRGRATLSIKKMPFSISDKSFDILKQKFQNAWKSL